MNHNMIRCALYTVAFAAPCWALAAIWWSLGAAVALTITGALAWIVAGYVEAA